jgi:hypothetical protein
MGDFIVEFFSERVDAGYADYEPTKPRMITEFVCEHLSDVGIGR